jgi:nucleotide-binding universal stress UspA family protein
MFKHIVVPIDKFALEGSDFSHLRDLILKDQAKVTFIHVSDPLPPAFYLQNGFGGDYITVPEHKKACDTYARRLFKEAQQSLGSSVKSESLHLYNPHTSDGIVEAASSLGADAIFMVSHKRAGVGRLLLGSQTHDVMSKAQVPIVVV